MPRSARHVQSIKGKRAPKPKRIDFPEDRLMQSFHARYPKACPDHSAFTSVTYTSVVKLPGLNRGDLFVLAARPEPGKDLTLSRRGAC